MSTDNTADPTLVSLPPLGPGTTLNDRYLLERCLASGGYGDVWACRDESEGRGVAVKILRTDAGNKDPSALARMRQEAEILRAIEHPNIVAVHAFETSAYGEFLVMELLDGLAIDQLLQTQGPADEARVIPVVRQLLRALHHAHGHEILHRDIKPENIILEATPDGEQAKLLDFGIAKVHRLLRDADEGVTLVHTRTGGFIGTPRYSAPEQAVGDPIGPRVDLFSLGLVVAEWLTGRQRLDGERYSDVISQLLSPDPIDLDDVPERWRGWLRRMTDKLAEARLASAEAALEAFERLVVGGHQPAAVDEPERFPGELELDGPDETRGRDAAPQLEVAQREAANSLVVNIGWVVGAFALTCALVFVLMWILRGS